MRSHYSRVTFLGLAQAIIVGWVLNNQHADPGLAYQVSETSAIDVRLHYVRDTVLAMPGLVMACHLASVAARRVLVRLGADDESLRARVVFAAIAAAAVAIASVRGAGLHAWLFEARQFTSRIG